LGEPAERLIGRNWQECFTAEHGASANEETLSGRLLTATGEQRWVSVRSVEVACGSPGTRLLSLHDIDAPMALAARHQRAHTLLDRTPDLVAHADAAGQLEYLNPHGCTLLGIAPETLPQRFLVDLFPTWAQPHFLHTCLPSAMQSGVWRGELALSGREGRHIPVMLTLIVHKPREGIAGCSGYSLLAHDVSAYKLREQRYKAAKEALEADQLLHASLLTNVSSNLVTPMARLREIVSALERDPARAADLLPLLRQQVQQAGQLVDATTEFLAHGAQRDLPLR
jgi:PAS domain-containing protein